MRAVHFPNAMFFMYKPFALTIVELVVTHATHGKLQVRQLTLLALLNLDRCRMSAIASSRRAYALLPISQ